jgi:hypothetical protein
MHGLLTDDQEAEDNMELQNMKNANGGGVDVSFQGLQHQHQHLLYVLLCTSRSST